jgi:MFS family permease
VRSLRGLDWLNFFLADVQTGVGPFLAAALTARRWNPEQVGIVLTVGGLVTIAVQGPAGAAVDALRKKRTIVALAIVGVAIAALAFAFSSSLPLVLSAQVLLGAVAPFLGPAVTAITLGLVGKRLFDVRLGRNNSFNSAGNVFAAVLLGWVGWHSGNRALFLTVSVLAIPALLSLAFIRANEIDYLRARGARRDGEPGNVSHFRVLLSDRVLLAFACATFLFHFANAAMLPQLSEMLARGHTRAAAPFMSAAVTVTQTVIALTALWVGKTAARIGRRPLLLLGFGVLPIRAVLYTLTSSVPLLVAIQILDGVANSIFVVASTLVVADRTSGTGRLNMALGGLAVAVGIGAALSNVVAGTVAQKLGFNVSFLVLGAIALLAFLALFIFVPETLRESHEAQHGHGASATGPLVSEV